MRKLLTSKVTTVLLIAFIAILSFFYINKQSQLNSDLSVSTIDFADLNIEAFPISDTEYELRLSKTGLSASGIELSLNFENITELKFIPDTAFDVILKNEFDSVTGYLDFGISRLNPELQYTFTAENKLVIGKIISDKKIEGISINREGSFLAVNKYTVVPGGFVILEK